jgi:hypothetical protein
MQAWKACRIRVTAPDSVATLWAIKTKAVQPPDVDNVREERWQPLRSVPKTNVLSNNLLAGLSAPLFYFR